MEPELLPGEVMPPAPDVFVWGVYINSKTRAAYVVTGLPRHTETGEDMVAYRAVHDGDREPYVRPFLHFIGATRVDGVLVPRFTLVTAKEIVAGQRSLEGLQLYASDRAGDLATRLLARVVTELRRCENLDWLFEPDYTLSPAANRIWAALDEEAAF